ncbi:MAG: hypothetical protein EP346_10775 [Bacteroidetes bacterium]|nr:MAG: hypothetical protein EP346_10775 [Bacteroidota bacterium]
MNRIIASSILALVLLSCSNSTHDEAGILRSKLAPDTVIAIDTPAVIKAEEERVPESVVNEPDSMIPFQLQNGSDTLIAFRDLNIENFDMDRIHLPKLKVYVEGDLVVIEHPEYEFKLREIPFDTTMSELTFTNEGEYLAYINDNNFYGTDGGIPKTQFGRFTFKKKEGDVQIVDPKYYDDLYNVGFINRRGKTNVKAFNVDENKALITFTGSDGAGGYIAVFLMNGEGEVTDRTIIIP